MAEGGLLALIGNQAKQSPLLWNDATDFITVQAGDTFDASLGDIFIPQAAPDTDGQIGMVDDTLQYFGSVGLHTVPQNLDDLEDVNAPAPNDGDVLSWNNGASEWQPTAQGAITLQGAYEGGNTIVTALADGDFDVSGTEAVSLDASKASNFTVAGAQLSLGTTGSGELDLTAAGLIDVNAAANLDVDVTGTMDFLSTGAFSIDGTGASNVSATSGNMTISTLTSGSLIGTSAADIDLNATTGITADGTTISIDGTDASNFTVTGASKDLTLSSVGGSVNVQGTEAAADAVRLYASGAAGGIDADAGTGGVTVDTTGAFSVDGAVASNVSVTGAQLQISTITSGELDITGAALVDLNAGANLDIDVTGTFDVLATGAGSLDFTGASNLSTTSGNLTLSTITSGDAIITSAAKVDINSATDTDIDATSGHISLDSTTASNFTVTGAADLTLSSTLGSAILASGESAVDAVRINATGANGGIDIDTLLGGVTVDTTGGFSIDGAASSNISVTGNQLQLSTISSGELDITSAGLMDVNAGANLDIDVTGNLTVDSTGTFSIDGVGASNLTTDSGNLTIENTTSGNLILDSAATVSVGETNATKIDIAQGGVPTEVKGDLTVDGDLVVLGEKIISKTTEVNIDDMVMLLGAGNTISASGQPGGLAVDFQATNTNATTAGAGVFTPGVDGVSNPTVTTDGSVFSAGDLVLVTGTTSTANNGLYAILSDAAGVATIYGVGTSGLPQSFPQNQFVSETDTGYTITKVNISVMEASDTGVWRMGKGSTLAGWTWENVGTADPTLQEAYDNGSDIVTDAAGGNIAFSGTEGFTADMDKQSSINVTGADLLLSTTTSGEIDMTAAGTVDINAGTSMTLDAATGVSIDAGAASNFSTSAGALTLDGNGGVNIAGNAAEIDITTSGALDLNGAAVTVDGSSGVSIDGTGAASNFTSTGQNLTISTITSGTLALTGAALVDLDAGANLDVDVTGSTNINSTTTTDIITQAGNLTLTNTDATADIVAKLGDAAGVAEFRVTDSADEDQFLVTTSGEAKVQSSYGFTGGPVLGQTLMVPNGTRIYVKNSSIDAITAGQLLMQNANGEYNVTGSPDLTSATNTASYIAAENIAAGNNGWAWLPGSVATVQTQEAVTAGDIALAYNNGKVVPEDTALILAGMKVQVIGRVLASAVAGTAKILYNPSFVMIMK